MCLWLLGVPYSLGSLPLFFLKFNLKPSLVILVPLGSRTAFLSLASPTSSAYMSSWVCSIASLVHTNIITKSESLAQKEKKMINCTSQAGWSLVKLSGEKTGNGTLQTRSLLRSSALGISICGWDGMDWREEEVTLWCRALRWPQPTPRQLRAVPEWSSVARTFSLSLVSHRMWVLPGRQSDSALETVPEKGFPRQLPSIWNKPFLLHKLFLAGPCGWHFAGSAPEQDRTLGTRVQSLPITWAQSEEDTPGHSSFLPSPAAYLCEWRWVKDTPVFCFPFILLSGFHTVLPCVCCCCPRHTLCRILSFCCYESGCIFCIITALSVVFASLSLYF